MVTPKPSAVGKRLEERNGRSIIVADEDLLPLPDRVVRDVLDEIRPEAGADGSVRPRGVRPR
jgi:hypothetical protein